MCGQFSYLDISLSFDTCDLFTLRTANDLALLYNYARTAAKGIGRSYKTVVDGDYPNERHTETFPVFEVMQQGLSSPHSSVRKAFLIHPLAEKQVLFLILDFL